MEKKEVDVCSCKTLRGIVQTINELGLSKEDIVTIIKEDTGWWHLLYQKNV